jgi:hypothetical protein
LVVSQVGEEVAQACALGSRSCDDVSIVLQGSCLVQGSVDIEESSFLGESSYWQVQLLGIADVDEVFCCS